VRKFKVGQKVVLPANPAEGWPEERGVIEGPSGPSTWVVRMEPDFAAGDDRLREVATTDIHKE